MGAISLKVRGEMQADEEPRVPLTDVMRVFVRKPGFLLNRIDQIANVLYGAHSTGGETLAQAEMMLAIVARAGSDQVGLARTCGIDTSTTAIILNNLEMTGLVTRQQDERDRRRSLPMLTDEGARRLPDVRAAFEALQVELLSGFDEAGRAALLAQLAHIAHLGNDSAPRWDIEDSPLADVPSQLFRRALQISHGRFHAAVAPATTTLRQFSALLILHMHPGLCQVEFARVYGLDPSTCAIVLKKLTSRGLLRAMRSPADGRKTLYYTTAEGREAAASLQAPADRSAGRMLAETAPDAVAKLVLSLQAIVRLHSPRLRFPGCLPWDESLFIAPVD